MCVIEWGERPPFFSTLMIYSYQCESVGIIIADDITFINSNASCLPHIMTAIYVAVGSPTYDMQLERAAVSLLHTLVDVIIHAIINAVH